MTDKEIKELQAQHAELVAKVEALEGENAELKAKASDKKEAPKKALTFSTDEGDFEFVGNAIKMDIDGQYKEFTAEQLLTTEGSGKDKKYVHADKLARLVASKSGVIRKKGGK